jgi:hypothetical protein
MGVSSSIQFRGSDNVLQAYDDRGTSAWSIWQKTQFMTRGIDRASLDAFLEILVNSGSDAIYTLKVYDDISDATKIKSGTQDDGSFNFRLTEADAGGIGYAGNAGGNFIRGKSPLEKRFDVLEEKMNLIIEGGIDDEVEEPKDFLGTITGLLQDPERLEKLITLGRSLLGQPVQPAYVGNVERLNSSQLPGEINPSLSPSPIDAEARLNRLGVAIDTLEKNDPQVIEHLEKLAKISVENPRQFIQLISMLDVI